MADLDPFDAIQQLVKALNAGSYGTGPNGGAGVGSTQGTNGGSVTITSGKAEESEPAGPAFDVEHIRQWKADKAKYPNKCPRCKGPAYVGLNDVDCKAKCSG